MTQFETNSVDEACSRFSKEDLPKLYNFNTPLTYSARKTEIVGQQKGFNPHICAHEFALLTIKENGSARRDYQSISEAPTFQIGMYIGGLILEDCLIVSDITDNGELVRPAKLSLQDLIGYETLKKFA